VKNVLRKTIVVFVVFFVVLGISFLGKNILSSQASAEMNITDEESVSMKTIKGRILRPVPPYNSCYINTGNKIRLCYAVWASSTGDIHITGGSDRINSIIEKNEGKVVEANGFWVNVKSPEFFVIKKITIVQ